MWAENGYVPIKLSRQGNNADSWKAGMQGARSSFCPQISQPRHSGALPTSLPGRYHPALARALVGGGFVHHSSDRTDTDSEGCKPMQHSATADKRTVLPLTPQKNWFLRIRGKGSSGSLGTQVKGCWVVMNSPRLQMPVGGRTIREVMEIWLQGEKSTCLGFLI